MRNANRISKLTVGLALVMALVAFVLGLIVKLAELDLMLDTTEWFWGGILLALLGMFFLIEASIRQSGES